MAISGASAPPPEPPSNLISKGWLVTVCALGALGFLIIVAMTRWGLDVGDDSYSYVRPARELLAGHGDQLSQHFSPLVPLVLALLGWLFHSDPLNVFRWLNAGLLAATLIMAGWIALELTRSRLLSIVAVVLLLLQPTFLQSFARAYSEALFIALMVAAYISFLRLEQNPHRAALMSGLFIGLAAAARYIGLAFVAAGLAVILLQPPGNWKSRLRLAAEFGVLAILPSALWFFHNWLAAEQLTDRRLGLDYFSANQIWKGWGVAFKWFLPSVTAGYLVKGLRETWAVLLVALSLLAGYDVLRRDARGVRMLWSSLRRPAVILFMVLSIVSYVLFLVASHTWFDPRIPLDARLLSPLLPAVVILAVVGAGALWRSSGRIPRVAAAGLLAIMALSNLPLAGATVWRYYRDGQGYLARRAHDSPTLAYLRKFPDLEIYSNERTALYFWLGRETNRLPNSNSAPAMKEEMAASGSLLVIFRAIPVELYQVTESELTEGLVVEAQFRDATVYRAPR